jgi:hypothetical protein
MSKLTMQDCLDILDRFKDWNIEQKSLSLVFDGIRTTEDDIFDQQRKLILKATTRLVDLSEQGED